jgi:hypothetical protein
MRWYLRCAVDNLKGVIPGQTLLRDCKRRLIPYKACTGRADATIEEGIQLINFVRSDRDIAGAACLEVGVGWEPLIPFLFSLCGARRVYMTDLNRLCSPQTAASAMEALRRNQDAIARGLGLDAAALARQLKSAPADMDELFALFRLEYLAPCNCANLPLADRSLDVVYSRAVLEHVPPAVIEHIFMEARRVLKDSGLMCHFVDPSDHLQHHDRSISRIHFLRFSDSAFRIVCLNPLNYHNRLRHPEYVRMLERTGFEILKEERNIDQSAVVFAKTQNLAPQFRRFSPEDLATVDSFFLARVAIKQ